MLKNTATGRRTMIQIITEWAMANLEMLSTSIVAIPMFIAAGVTFFFMIDGQCYEYAWYRCIIYGKAERDDAYVDEFFAGAFIVLGIVNIVIPFIIVYGYLYYSNMSFSQFIIGQTGG